MQNHSRVNLTLPDCEASWSPWRSMPKLDDRAVGVKVRSKFDQSALAFNSIPFKPSEFDTELQGAIY